MNDSRIGAILDDAAGLMLGPTWRRALAEAVRDPDELCDLLELPERFREPARKAAVLFPLVVPRGFVRLMKVGDPRDPLLMQVLPLDAECNAVPGFVGDPLNESAATVLPGMLRKYAGRALLILSGDCAINCRYCFRRSFPYEQTPSSIAEWETALQAIEGDESIVEVLLSGGDPLTRTDAWLARIFERLRSIQRLERIRIHTRLPIVLPERVTDELIDLLRPRPSNDDNAWPVQTVVVIHANHRNELGDACAAALAKLARAGVVLLNQSVLLRGVNDSAATLAALSQRLLACGVLPYYLHQLDRVHGAGHFEVTIAEGQAIMSDLRGMLPGYLIPKYVVERPGADSKTPL